MANYALITGMDIESVGGEAWCLLQGKVLGHAYSNTVEIHNFLRSIGYISVHIIRSSVFRIDFEKELKSICTKLKDGDKFFLYYYGPATFDRHDQYIFSSGARVNIELIEKYTAICGVERIILLDLYRSNEYHSIGETRLCRDELVERVVENASSNSPIGFYYNYNETSFPMEFYFNNNETFPPEGESLFAKTVLSHFSLQAQQGLEISFPAIGELISETFKEESSDTMSDSCGQVPCFIGNKVVILPKRKAGSSNAPLLSEKQKKEKGKADQQLELVLHEHEKWLSNGRPIGNSDRLTWQKLEPIFAIYERYNLGPIELTDRKINYADLTSARFPYGTRLSGSSLCNSLFDHARFDGVNFSDCKMEECIFESTTATQCEFCKSSFDRSRFRSSDFICCNFNEASMFECNFFMTAVDKSFFINARLISSVVFGCRAHKTNFTNATLACSILNGTDFSGAILTGVNLCGSAHTDWCIEGVECQYVYWDREGKERFPPDNDFHEGEFYTQYRPYAEFSYTFKEGITPLDLMLATHIVDQINAAEMGFKIKIDNASIRGLNPTLNFIMETGDDKRAEAKELFKIIYEQKIDLLELKLQNSENLLAERTRRANLAEDQLTEMTALVKQTSAENNPDLTTPQMLVKHVFNPIMEELFKDDGPIAKKSRNMSKHFACFNRSDLAQYRYIALFGMNTHSDEVPTLEFDLLCARLASFLKDDCLMLLNSELKDLPEDSYIRSIYRIFDNPPKKAAFVGIATVFPGINDRFLLNPVYHELKWDDDDSSRYHRYNALNQCLDHLQASLTYSSLEQVPLPELPHASQELVIPNGKYIATLRKNAGMSMEEVGCQRTETGLSTADRKTISKAEKSEPITRDVMEHIAEVFSEPYNRVVFKKIVPPKGRFREIRLESGRTKDELAKECGLPSSLVFDLLESATCLSADRLIFFYYHYKKILGEKKLSFESLIDFSRTNSDPSEPNGTP